MSGRWIGILALLTIGSVVAEWFIHRHPEFPFSALPGFYAGTALLTVCALAALARVLHRVLSRPEPSDD